MQYHVYISGGIVTGTGAIADDTSVSVVISSDTQIATVTAEQAAAILPGQLATENEGVWTFSAAPPKPYPTVAAIDFKLLFTTAEYVAIKGSDDPVVQALYELVQDALSTGTPIYLGTPRVQTGLAYMSANPTGSPILAADRAAAISAGTPATS